MKVTFSLSFYHIPKFLKNDLIKRLEINIQHRLDGMLISKLSAAEAVYGGAKRDRTADLLRARQALSQLSYGPITKLVGLGRFELPTSPLSGVRSNQLSYRPNFELVTVSVSYQLGA
ncbi:protein of unknown function [Pseudomonas mediterranea]